MPMGKALMRFDNSPLVCERINGTHNISSCFRQKVSIDIVIVPEVAQGYHGYHQQSTETPAIRMTIFCGQYLHLFTDGDTDKSSCGFVISPHQSRPDNIPPVGIIIVTFNPGLVSHEVNRADKTPLHCSGWD